MIGFTRNIEHELAQWRSSPHRKPLLLRGARQVGKTTVVKAFGAKYKQFIYLNLERRSDAKPFEEIEDTPKLLEALLFLHNTSYIPNETLLFIDEIQAVPNAVNRLRYLHEDFPELHLIAAGSLLETLLSENTAIPVGRLTYKVLRPVSFAEFLNALDETQALTQFLKTPLDDFAHEKLLSLFNSYAIIGGMPEIVRNYTEYRAPAKLAEIYASLVESYSNDVEKYARNSNMVQVIRHVISSLSMNAATRIKFEGFGKSNYGSREAGEALRSLEKAMLLYLLYPSTQAELPLVPDKRKSPRLQIIDTGIMNYFNGLQREMVLLKDLQNIYQGKVIEHLTGQELLAANTDIHYRPVWWVRDKKDASAEVDYLLISRGDIIPVEVKSGAAGKLRSILVFMNMVPHPYAIRLYAGKLKIDKVRTSSGKEVILLNLPYYLAARLDFYIEWLKENPNPSKFN